MLGTWARRAPPLPEMCPFFVRFLCVVSAFGTKKHPSGGFIRYAFLERPSVQMTREKSGFQVGSRFEFCASVRLSVCPSRNRGNLEIETVGPQVLLFRSIERVKKRGYHVV